MTSHENTQKNLIGLNKLIEKHGTVTKFAQSLKIPRNTVQNWLCCHQISKSSIDLVLTNNPEFKLKDIRCDLVKTDES